MHETACVLFIFISTGGSRRSLSKRTHNTKATAMPMTQFDPSIRCYKRNGVLSERSATKSVNICNAPPCAANTMYVYIARAASSSRHPLTYYGSCAMHVPGTPTDARCGLASDCLIDRPARSSTPAGGARA